MSPIALASQHAAVLHGPKDLRVEDRTLWPPSQGQVQVAVKATGLCGSDCESHLQIPPLYLPLMIYQCTIISTVATATLPSVPRSSWVMKQQALLQP